MVCDFGLLIEVISNLTPEITAVLIGTNCRILTNSKVADCKLFLFNSCPVGGSPFDLRRGLCRCRHEVRKSVEKRR